MKDLMGMMKQAKQLQEKMQAMQEEVAATVDRRRGGRRPRHGHHQRQRRDEGAPIDPSLVKPEEVEILEDLIVAAINDARSRRKPGWPRRCATDRRPGPAARMKLPF